MVGVRDDDPLVRASNVSNLGELCKMLRFSLGSVVNEVSFSMQTIVFVLIDYTYFLCDIAIFICLSINLIVEYLAMLCCICTML